ncbi:chemotaxis protein CheA [uncultured Anaerovibrio sp.]|uniref:chemotaxis protein CheA n=1 Tax=uncultured Anaerovibrio sp. TaxID=361586 RepID=UPI00262A0A75|nr:chemotaxis protein CheA [uncultured Anaerovibrio sp.]
MAEPMVEIFIFETRQFLEQLEQIALGSEEQGGFSEEDVNEIFRAMHTIKGSAAMMMFDQVSTLAHSVEDIFFYIRELKPEKVDATAITDIVLNAVDFMRIEMEKLDAGGSPDMSSEELRNYTKEFLRNMKIDNGHDPDIDLRKVKNAQKAGAEGGQAPAPEPEPPKKFYIGAAKPTAPPPESTGTAGQQHVFEATIFFQDGCEMEEVRAFGVVNSLKDKVKELHYLPEKILEDESATDTIRNMGFRLFFTTLQNYDEVKTELEQTIFLDHMELKEVGSVSELEYWPSQETIAITALENSEPIKPAMPPVQRDLTGEARKPTPARGGDGAQMITVRVDKLDKLMDLVGEMVIAEAMVTQNPDLKGLELDNFAKAARQLHKINGELQDSVMALRMVPLEGTFKKMNRIVRDMTKKLGKKARLVLVGESTEVDKNINEHISDPLMHIVRNSVDHGIEMPDVRVDAGKEETGTVILSAENVGGEVVIKIKDDGGGLNKEKILERARKNGILTKPESELTDREIYSFIFAPGFSTKEAVTEFSGRGVGMDVVVSNIKALGGKVIVDSEPGLGSTTTIKIPLTLAIIEGMSVSVGGSRFTVPINYISRSFRPEEGAIFKDPDGSEMIMVQGSCCPVVRLYDMYGIADAIQEPTEGILLLLEAGDTRFGVLADELLGVQEIVVKPVPKYISRMMKTTGISGCTLLGDGSISLIIDPQQVHNIIFD